MASRRGGPLDPARDLAGRPDDLTDGDVEEAWAREVEHRLQAVDAGSAKLEDWATVHARILARLRALWPVRPGRT